MAARTSTYTSYYDPRSGRMVRRSTRRRTARRVSGLGSLGSFGQATGLKATMASVKGVLITGAIAAGGAIVTDQVYDKIGASLNLSGWKRDLAKMATGIALGIILAKITKKPKLAAAFAIGPVVAGAIRLFSDVMGSPLNGLGLTTFTPATAFQNMYAPMYGTNGLGLNTYDAVGAPLNEFAPPAPPPPPLNMTGAMSGHYAMPG